MGLFNRVSRDPRAGKSRNVSALVNADFAGVATADVAVTAGTYVVVGTRTVPFGVLQAWGANDTTGTANIAGVQAYVNLAIAAGTALAGSIRLVVADPQRVNLVRVYENRSELFNASTNDRTKAILLPEMMPLVQPQSLMEIWFKSDTTDTIDYDHANTLIRIPTTFYVG